MHIITRRDKIKGAPAAYQQQYSTMLQRQRMHGAGTFQQALDKLNALDTNTCTAKDIADIIGNDSWTDLKCDECNTKVDTVVQLGQDEDYDSRTAYVCQECLYDALSKLEEM